MADVTISDLPVGTPSNLDVLPFSTGTSTNKVSLNNLKTALAVPAAQVNSDWNATSGVAQILNKPTISTPPVTPIAGYLLQSTNSGTNFTLLRSFGLTSVTFASNVWTLNYAAPLANRFVIVAGVGGFSSGSAGYKPAVLTDGSYIYTTASMSTTFVKVLVSARGAGSVDTSHSILVFA